MALEPDLAAVSVLADEYALRILHAVADRARPASEIARIANVPPAACYRRLHELEAAGLVAPVGSVPSRNGKLARTFQATVSRFDVTYDGGRLFVNLNLRGGGTREFVVTLPTEP